MTDLDLLIEVVKRAFSEAGFVVEKNGKWSISSNYIHISHDSLTTVNFPRLGFVKVMPDGKMLSKFLTAHRGACKSYLIQDHIEFFKGALDD